MMDKSAKIYIAGHKGTAGTAIHEKLLSLGYSNIVIKTRKELDLINQAQVVDFFKTERPEYVFLCAVNPCGAATSKNRADFIYENTMIQNNIIHQSYVHGVKKMIFFGSGYMYPEHASNPIVEDSFMTGELEYNALPFGVAKISGTLMCESYNLQYGTNFLTIALNNLYGTRANFNLSEARVLPALIKKFHVAKLLSNNEFKKLRSELGLNTKEEVLKYCDDFGISDKYVEIWGTGKVRREFIHSDDLADAAIYVMNNIDFQSTYKSNESIKNSQINVGTNIDYTIKEVALMVKDIVGFQGELKFNPSKPDSTMDRLMDSSKLNNLGWKHKIELKDGIQMMYDWYINSFIKE